MRNALFALVSVLIFFAGCQTVPTDIVNTNPENSGTYVVVDNKNKSGEGRFDVVKNTVPIISLKGNHAEIGKQHGELLSEEIRNFYNEIVLPYIEKRNGRDFFLTTAKEYLLPYIEESYVEEMQAIASASGMKFDDVLLINTFIDTATALAGKNNELTPVVGVSFAFVDELSDYDGPLVGRNIDVRFAHGKQNKLHSFTFVIHPMHGKPYMYISWPGMVGTLTGMNFGGLAVTGNPVTGPSGLKAGTPYTILFRKLLEQCDEVKQAHQVIIASDLVTGNNVMLVDTRDNVWVLECTPNKISVKRAHPKVHKMHDIPTYTLSCQDIFSSQILRNEMLGAMPEHEERTKTLRSRLGNLGHPWNVKDMTTFAGKLANDSKTVLSVVMIPYQQNLWI